MSIDHENRQPMSPLQAIRNLLEMIRFSHTVFALPFALLAFLMARMASSQYSSEFRLQWVAGVLIAMVGARSAAMAFNRLVDRRVDGANPRTAGRHLPAGILSVRMVVLFTVISIGVYLAGALCFLPNRLPLIAALPVLAVLLGYSYAKRFTALSHLWLGFALGLAPVCVWLALRDRQILQDVGDLVPAGLMGLAIMFWVAGFDMIYACQDAEFDRQTGLNSVPARMGVRGALTTAAAMHFLSVVFFAMLPLSSWMGGPHVGLGAIWYTGLAGVAGLLVWEHRLVRPDDLTRVNIAFFHVNAVISIGLLVVGGVDLLLEPVP